MTITRSLSDTAILAELGTRLAQARLDRNLSQDRLATEAGVSKRTIERLETGHSAQLASLIRVLRALDLAEHIDLLIPAPATSPLAQLKLQGRKRERASRQPRGGRSAATTWTWDDES